MAHTAPFALAACCALSTLATRALAAERGDAELALEEAREEALGPASTLGPVSPAGGGRSLWFSLDLGAGRRAVGVAAQPVWFVGIAVAIPFDRLFGAGRPPRHVVVGDGFARGLSARPEEIMSDKRRWGAALALPSALALAPAARGGGRAEVGAAASTSASTHASTRASTSAAPSLAPSLAASLRLPPAIRASASVSASPAVAGVTSPEPAPEVSIAPGAVRAMIRAAWHEAGLDNEQRLDALSERARSSAWAPEVRLRAYRGTNAGASTYASIEAVDRSTLSDGVSTLVETRLIWRLDRVVFADEEVAIERVRLERAELRQRLASRIIELALAWLRARRAAEDPSLLGPDRELAAATAGEAQIALDALTGGAASKLLGGAPAP